MLKPRKEWPDPNLPKEELVERIEKKVSTIPGNGYEITQPIQMRFNELVAGVRAEQTNIDARGPFNDPTRDYQRDSAGKVLRGANNAPLLIVPTNAGLAYSQLTLLDRGYRAQKEYLRLFPSLNASYNLRENLVARAAFITHKLPVMTTRCSNHPQTTYPPILPKIHRRQTRLGSPRLKKTQPR